jgi:peptidoglycan/xylan/chitin deacetylase (PgdA/CDA1 family)
LRNKPFSKSFDREATGTISRRDFLNLSAGLVLSGSLWPSVADELAIVQGTPRGYLKPERGETLPLGSLLDGWEKDVGDPRPDAKSVFLTFDDGPLYCTAGILDLLALRGHKATFFVIGRNLANPKLRELAVKALREGHDIANHSYDHPDFSTISTKRAVKEITSTHALVEELVREAGVDSARQNLFFRFPYGVAGSRSNHAACRDVLAELNYKIAWWNLDTNDWRMELAWFPRPASRVIRSLNIARPQDVVLLHDRMQTMKHLAAILDVVESRRLVSVPLSNYIFADKKAPEGDPKTKTAGAGTPETNPDSDDLVTELCRSLFPQKQISVWSQRPVSPPPAGTRRTFW